MSLFRKKPKSQGEQLAAWRIGSIPSRDFDAETESLLGELDVPVERDRQGFTVSLERRPAAPALARRGPRVRRPRVPRRHARRPRAHRPAAPQPRPAAALVRDRGRRGRTRSPRASSSRSTRSTARRRCSRSRPSPRCSATTPSPTARAQLRLPERGEMAEQAAEARLRAAPRGGPRGGRPGGRRARRPLGDRGRARRRAGDPARHRRERPLHARARLRRRDRARPDAALDARDERLVRRAARARAAGRRGGRVRGLRRVRRRAPAAGGGLGRRADRCASPTCTTRRRGARERRDRASRSGCSCSWWSATSTPSARCGGARASSTSRPRPALWPFSMPLWRGAARALPVLGRVDPAAPRRRHHLRPDRLRLALLRRRDVDRPARADRHDLPRLPHHVLQPPEVPRAADLARRPRRRGGVARRRERGQRG